MSFASARSLREACSIRASHSGDQTWGNSVCRTWDNSVERSAKGEAMRHAAGGRFNGVVAAAGAVVALAVPQAASAQAVTPAAPAGDEHTPVAYGGFSWLNGSPRKKEGAVGAAFFAPDVR